MTLATEYSDTLLGTIKQLTRCQRSPEIELDEDARKKPDQIWPGPGGPAPEAYAW